MSEVVWLEVFPRNPATAATVQILLAGGGQDMPYRHPASGVQFRAGIVARPLFSAQLGFGAEGWTGNTRPRTSALSFSTSDPALRDQLAALVWDSASAKIQVGPEGQIPATELVGKVKDATFTRAGVTLTIVDLAEGLEKPLTTARFSGEGGIEGPKEAAGRLKRRSFGQVFNVEGELIDVANSIYEFGDPAYGFAAWTALRDKGRDGPYAVLDWQGSIAATFAALQDSEPAEGGGVVAPSIACAKWWTQPSGPLTADMIGTTGTGGTIEPAAIADAISKLANGPAVENLATAIALRSSPAGIHIGSDRESYAQAIDRLLLGVSLLWLPQPGGTIAIQPWAFDEDAPVLQAEFKGRSRTYPPHGRRRVGFQRNERQHSNSELAGILLDEISDGNGEVAREDLLNGFQKWSDIQDDGGKPEDNATVGAPSGTPVGDRSADQVTGALDDHTAEWILQTAKNIDVDAEIVTAKQDIADLFSGYGTAQDFVDAAELASTNASNAEAAAVLASSDAQTAASTATSQASLAATASALASTRLALTPNGDFTLGLDGWNKYYQNALASNLPEFTPATVDSRSVISSNVPSARKDLGSLTLQPVKVGRTYRATMIVKAVGGSPTVYAMLCFFDATKTFVSNQSAAAVITPAQGWVTIISEYKVLGTEGDYSYVAPGSITNAASVAGVTGLHVDALYLEDITERTAAGAAASASASSASAAAASVTSAGNSASAANLSKLAAETAKGGAESAQNAAVSARDTAQGHASSASTSSALAATYRDGAVQAAANSFPAFQPSNNDLFTVALSGEQTGIANALLAAQWASGGFYQQTWAGAGTNAAYINFRGLVKIQAGRRYKVAARGAWYTYGGGNQATSYMRAQFAYLDSSFNYLTADANTVTGSGMKTSVLEMTAEQIWAAAPGAVYFRPGVRLQVVDATGSSRCDLYDLTFDDTSVVASAETQANIATSQAIIATDKAAAATATSTLVAQMNTGAINPNPNFLDWPDGQELPTKWTYWTGSILSEYSAISNSKVVRAAASSPADSKGIILNYTLTEMSYFTGGSYYVLELDCRAITGPGWAGYGLAAYWYNGSDTLLGYSSLAPSLDRLPDGSWAPFSSGSVHRLRKLVQAPAGARKVRLYIFGNYDNGLVGGSYGAGTRTIDTYRAAIRAASNEDALSGTAIPSLQASVAVNSSAIASAENTAAFFEILVAASGGNPAAVRLLAGKNGSAIDLVSEVLRIRNPVGGALVDVATFEGGVAKLNAALIRNLAVAPTATSNIFHKVQLEPIRITGTHGQAKQYQGGNAYSSLPTITRDTTGEVLPTLPAGEAYDIRPINITTSQFTIRAVKLVAAGAAAQNSAAGTNAGGTPQWQTDKPTTANASDGDYTFSGTATLAKYGDSEIVIIDEGDPSSWSKVTTYRGTITLYGKVGSSWVALATKTVTRTYRTDTSVSHPTSKSYTFSETITSSSNFGSGSARFGVHPGTAVITAFAGVSYNTQTTSNEVALGGNFKFIVNPPTE